MQFWKNLRKKSKKQNDIVLIARSETNSIENITLKVLIDNEVSHEEFKTIINEEDKWCKLKESVSMRKIQRSNTGKNWSKIAKIDNWWNYFFKKVKKFMTIYKIDFFVYIKLNNISSTDLYWIKCKGCR